MLNSGKAMQVDMSNLKLINKEKNSYGKKYISLLSLCRLGKDMSRPYMYYLELYVLSWDMKKRKNFNKDSATLNSSNNCQRCFDSYYMSYCRQITFHYYQNSHLEVRKGNYY